MCNISLDEDIWEYPDYLFWLLSILSDIGIMLLCCMSVRSEKNDTSPAQIFLCWINGGWKCDIMFIKKFGLYANFGDVKISQGG